MGTFAGLVLAGRRGPRDSLAEGEGTSHRALMPVAGVPMLVRVLRALEASRAVDGVTVSIDAPKALRGVPELALALDRGALATHESLDSPSRSVSDALARGGGAPVLVTTADHALLTPEIIDHFADAACASDADALVGLVSRRVIRERYPHTTRTYVPLRGESWSGANLFAFKTARARKVADFWVRAERHRKQPWRLVSAVGPGALIQFLLRRLDLEAAFAHLSRAAGAAVRPVPLPFAEAAIDVDRPSDLELATRILRARR